jgi:hypothetical protein
MLDLLWLVSGLIVGMLLATVFIPPTRNKKVLPSPFDPNTYHTDTGCVRFVSEEVPCTQEADSLNLLASVATKQ